MMNKTEVFCEYEIFFAAPSALHVCMKLQFCHRFLPLFPTKLITRPYYFFVRVFTLVEILEGYLVRESDRRVCRSDIDEEDIAISCAALK
jgi:hypothetical protein